MKSTLFSLATLTATSLLADPCCNPCCPAPEPIDPCHEHLFVERSQFFTHLEFLYWTVEEGSVDYAIKMDQPAPLNPTFGIGRYENACYEYRPGYRLAISWYNRPKYWEVSAQYTWLYNRGNDAANAPTNPNEFLTPTWGTITSPPFQRAKSLIDLHYHVGDFFVARVFDPNPHLRMRLVGGITTGYIEQSWKVRYTDFAGNSDRLKSKWRYWGGGLRLGVTVDWFWGNQIYFTGKTNFATLLGGYKNQTTQEVTPNKTIALDTLFKDTRFSFHSQFMLGPSWQVPCECWSFELFAGYEFNIWLNLHETFRTSSAVPNAPKITNNAYGLFGLHGLTVRLTLGF